MVTNEVSIARSSHQRCSIIKAVCRNCAKFTGKHLCQSFLNKVGGLRPATLFKKRLGHRCFPQSFAKFLRTPFLQNTSGRLGPCKSYLWLQYRGFKLVTTDVSYDWTNWLNTQYSPAIGYKLVVAATAPERHYNSPYLLI